MVACHRDRVTKQHADTITEPQQCCRQYPKRHHQRRELTLSLSLSFSFSLTRTHTRNIALAKGQALHRRDTETRTSLSGRAPRRPLPNPLSVLLLFSFHPLHFPVKRQGQQEFTRERPTLLRMSRNLDDFV